MATKYHLRDMDGSGIYPEQFRNPVGQNQVEPSVRCPHCMKVGIFHSFNGISDLSFTNTLKHPNGMPYQKLYLAGLRGCPNSECRGLLFVIIEGGGNLVLSHPAEVLDFDASDLPPRLSLTLEEAISCHSHRAYRAAAMMVRRLLEVLCDDMGASGANLKESWFRKSAQDDRWSFCLTAGTLCPANQETP